MIVQNWGIEVPAITLRELIRDHGIEVIDLMKVDIEGTEAEVFSSGDGLDCVRHMIVELHNSYTSQQFSDDVTRFGLVPEHGRVWPIAVAHRKPA
jgi:hypothetical protein